MSKQKIRAKKPHLQRGDDRARGPRQDDVDGGDPKVLAKRGATFVPVRSDRQGAGGAGAGITIANGARGVRDEGTATTAHVTVRGTPTT